MINIKLPNQKKKDTILQTIRFSGDIRGMYEIVGKAKGMITTDNGITRIIDLIDGIDILTKEKIDDNKIHF